MDQTRLAASKHFAVNPFCERRNIQRQYAEKAWNSIRRQSKDRSDFDEDENLDRPAYGLIEFKSLLLQSPHCADPTAGALIA
jgi:hypothetical protein